MEANGFERGSRLENLNKKDEGEQERERENAGIMIEKMLDFGDTIFSNYNILWRYYKELWLKYLAFL